MKPVLIHIRPMAVPLAGRIDVRVADGAAADVFGAGGLVWDAAIVERPKLSIELFNATMDGKMQAGRAQFSLALNAVTAHPRPKDLYWKGAEVVIWDVDTPAWSTPTFRGHVTDGTPDRETGRLSITAEVSGAVLIDKPLLTLTFGGGGGADGDGGKRGVFKPAGFGSVENIEPVWFDQTRNIGMIDGYGNTVAINWLGEGRSSFGASVADYPTYAALAAAIDAKAVPRGRWATCLAEGMVGLGAPPNGVITVDAVFGSNRIGAMVLRILGTHAGITADRLDTGAFAALDAAVNRAVRYWTADQRNIRDLVEALARSANASPFLTFAGRFSITRVVGGAPSLELDLSGGTAPRVLNVRNAAVEPPAYRLAARTARPARVLSYAEVNYKDDFDDTNGLYKVDEVYRAGDLVWLASGAKFLFIADTPAAGRPLPTVTYPPEPPASNAYWQQLLPPTVAVGPDGLPLTDLISAVRDIADGKTTTFIRSTAPSAAESQENDIWLNTLLGNRVYRRVAGSGVLSIGGDRVTLGGGGIELCWAEAPDQRIAQALIDAAGAKAIADGKVESFEMRSPFDPVPTGSGVGDMLYRTYLTPPQIDRWTGTTWVPQATYGATSEQAGSIAQSAAAIISILSDAILSRAEKPAFIREWLRAQADYAALVEKAAGFAGVDDEIAALSAAYTALALAIMALTPLYSDVTQDSAIPDAPAFQAKWVTFFDAHATLLMAITAQTLVVQWSVDGATGWHADFTAGDLYQRQSTDGGATWGAPFKAVGEDGVGTPGQDGKFTSFVFKRAATAPDVPTDEATPPAGWSDAPPAQTVPATALWQTSADFRGDDRLTAWAAPKKLVPADLEDLDPGAKLILDEARDVAHGKNKTFFRATPPTAAESQEDDIWFNTAEGNFAYRRVAGSGRLAIGGDAITLGGSYVTLCWTPAPDQRIALVVQDVAHTLGIAEEADAKADAAIGSILTLGDDSKLDPSEKIKTLIPKNAELEAAWAILDAQAGDFGITAERTATAAARAAWASYRDGLAPAWDATGFETSIVRATFRTKLGNYEAAIETLKRAISAEAARRAHWSAIVDDNGHRPEPGADVTANAQVSIVPPAQAVVTADYQGTFTAGQFPKVMTPQVARGGASIRTADTTSYALASISAGGTGAVTVNNTNGSADKGRITVTDAMTASFTFTLIITINGIVQAPIPLAVIVERAPPPTGGGGSGGGTGNKSGTDSNFPWLDTTTYVEWSDVFTVDVASGETLRCFAALDYQYQGGAGTGNYVLAAWRYRTSPSGSWIDISGAVAGGNSGVPSDPGGGGGLPTPIDPEDPPADPYPGGITCNQNKAGLSAGLYDVALFARLGTSGGGIGVTAGTASVNVST